MTAYASASVSDRNRARTLVERARHSYLGRAELECALRLHPPQEINGALGCLSQGETICLVGEDCWASQCACHLERMQLIGI